MGDEYVTIEHLWLSFETNSEVSKMLKDMGVTKNLLEGGIKELRKGSKQLLQVQKKLISL
jgi:ATP-dependent Clp protease ATP-binding subunit ClpB